MRPSGSAGARQVLLDLHRGAAPDAPASHHQSPSGSSRRLLLLPLFPALANRHPAQVLKLCGPEPLTKYLVLAVVALQLLCAFLLRDAPFGSPAFLITAYAVGATANQNLFLAIHEISHNLAFRSAPANRLLAVVANLPIAVPYSAAFRVRHLRQTSHILQP